MSDKRFDPKELELDTWPHIGSLWMEHLEKRLSLWAAANGIKSLALFGAGTTARLILLAARKIGLDVSAVYHRGTETGLFESVPLLPLAELKNRGAGPVIVASSRLPARLEEPAAAIASQGGRAVFMAEIIRDEHPDWMHFFDVIPPECPLRSPFVDESKREFWEGYGFRWANQAHPADSPVRPGVQESILCDQVRRLAPRSLLEVGCGAGRILAPVRRSAPSSCLVMGCDISARMMAQGRAGITGVPFVQADASRGLPFASDSFDLVFAVAAIQHLPPETLPAALEEMVRVSRAFIIHWEYRWPGEHGFFTFDHDLASWYRDRNMELERLDPGAADSFPDEPGRAQFFQVSLDTKKQARHSP